MSGACRIRILCVGLAAYRRLPLYPLRTGIVTALRAIVISHDVVLGIYPCAEGMGLHVIKGDELLRQIANSNEVCEYTHATIAVPDREQAETLQALVA